MQSLTVPYPPMPAPRPRFSKFGAYNPKKYTDHKRAIALLAKNIFTPREGAIKIMCIFYMPIPKSWSKKKKIEAVGKYHIKKPDSDNLLKTIKDALNGIAYVDDSQVSVTITHKIYSDEPRTEIYVTVL